MLPSALTDLKERFGSFQTQHWRAHDHKRTFRIMITTAVTASNSGLIVETIITSYTGIAYHLEYHAQGTRPHHGFSQLTNIECACVEHYLPNRVSVHGPVSETPTSVQNLRFLCSHIVSNYELHLRLFLTAWMWRLLV